MDCTRVTDPDEATRLIRAWFSGWMNSARGVSGLLLATGHVMRITFVIALHHALDGTVLVDVLFDRAGPPDGTDLA